MAKVDSEAKQAMQQAGWPVFAGDAWNSKAEGGWEMVDYPIFAGDACPEMVDYPKKPKLFMVKPAYWNLTFP